jgi:hypothetical protein
MRRFLLCGLLLVIVSGCATAGRWAEPLWWPRPTYVENPVFVPAADPHCTWETVADVVDDYFEIQREEPVRVIGTVLTEGRLETRPKVASTIFEPWHHDSVGPYEKLHSTLQSLRRRAEVRVVPDQGGYWVHVAVFEELEDVAQPFGATVASATFRNDSSLTRVVNPIGEQETNQGWIPQGHDVALEQEILAQLRARLGAVRPCTLQPVPDPTPGP